MSPDGERLLPRVKQAPKQPGVYVFYDKAGKPLYIGKAKNLRQRLHSHLSNPQTRGRETLLKRTLVLDWTVTQDEWQALLLEQNMIQSMNPKYNVRLRYGNAYARIAVSVGEDYPRIYMTREKAKPGCKYYGPYDKKEGAQLVQILMKGLFIRSCRGPRPGRSTGSPCLDFHIGLCQAPCIDNVSQEQYRLQVSCALQFLSGRSKPLMNFLQDKMQQQAHSLDFEQAAVTRNHLAFLSKFVVKTAAAGVGAMDCDVIGFAQDNQNIHVCVLEIRHGELFGKRMLEFESSGFEQQLEQELTQFILQLYSSQSCPATLVIPSEIKSKDITAFLSQHHGYAVSARHARRGSLAGFATLAQENAALKL